MSLAQRVTARSMNDLLNEGFKTTVVGTVNTGTDQTIFAASASRGLIVTGAHLSTSGSAQLVSLGFKSGGNATITFFEAYISSSCPALFAWPLGDWRYGDLNYNLVLTAASNAVAYSVFCRVYSTPAPLGYLEQPGAQAHHSPIFPPESGSARGESEF